MTRLMKLGRTVLALVLAFALTLGLCANGLVAFAAGNTDTQSQKDAILKEFFGEGVSTEEAFDILLAESAKMEDYENQPFYYKPDKKNSYYVALGDETAAGKGGATNSYVDYLAEELQVSMSNRAKSQMLIEEAYDQITKYKDEIAKADLITVGWSNYNATNYMCRYLVNQADMVTEEQWTALVGEENMPLLEELLNQMFQKLRENNLSEFGGFDLEGGLECFAYVYLSQIIHQPQVIEAIRVINPDAVIVLVGTYNDVENVVLSANGMSLDLGETMQDLVNVSNLMATKTAAAYDRVTYVHAPDVTTTLDTKDTSGYDAKKYVSAIAFREGLPYLKKNAEDANPDGHEYIKNQIHGCISDTCNHIWDEGTVTTNPTCNKTGVKTFVCRWCGEQKTETLPVTGEHQTATREENRKEATCAAAGSYNLVTYCTVCNSVLNRETKTIAATGHDYVSEVTEPSCTTGGFTTHTCSKCGDSYTDSETAPLDHNFGDWTVTKAATCVATGERVRICTVCGKEEKETLAVDPNAHTGVNHTEGEKDATCGAPGYTGDTVCECGVIIAEGEEIPVLEHSFGDWTVTKSATCVATGEKVRTCANCGEEQKEILPVDATAHTGVNHTENEKAATCTEPGYTGDTVCECGATVMLGEEIKPLDHSFGEWTQTKAPSCTVAGEERRDCANCDHFETRTVAVTEHTYEAVVTEPTCTTDGYTTYTCTGCGRVRTGEKVAALGHDWQTTTTNETCCENGLITRTCSVCDSVETESIPANGEHDLVYTDNENGVGHSVACRNSGKVINENEVHDFVDGICSNCGAEEICQHQWDEGVVTKEATCVTTGEKLYTCGECGEQYTQVLALDSNAHTGINHVENAKDATCSEPGYTGDTVCECGVTVDSGEEIPVLEHSYGDWVVTKTPTCTDLGEERRECANCDHYETNALALAEHEYEAVVTAPTCTAGGYTTHTCANCGEQYVDSETAAIEHSYVDGKCEYCGNPEVTILLGDVNGDGKINARDARLLLRHAAGLVGDDEIVLAAADYNGDGKINARDARAVLRFAAGLD